jgi:hypothetical protein
MELKKVVQKTPPLVPILQHIKPVHALMSYFFKIHFNIILQPKHVSEICRFDNWYNCFNCYQPHESL